MPKRYKKFNALFIIYNHGKKKKRKKSVTLLANLFLMIFQMPLYLLHADQLSLPASTKKETSSLPLLEPVLQNDSKRKKKSFDKNMEKIMEKVLHGSEEDIEEQAKTFIENQAAFKKFLDFLPNKLKKKVDKNTANATPKPTAKNALHFLREQYCDTQFEGKTISLSLKESYVEDAIELVSKAVGVNFIIDNDVGGTVKNINLQGVPASYVLHTLLSNNKPPLALIKEFDVFRIMFLSKAQKIANDLIEYNRQCNFTTDSYTVNHQKFSESFKLRVEKMWQSISQGRAAKQDYYIVFDDISKKIFFRGKKSHVKKFLSFLHQIDLEVPQVQIEARVIIADKDFEESFGLQLSNVFNRQNRVKKGINFIGSGPLEVIKNKPSEQTKESIMDWALNFFPTVATTARRLHIPFVFGGNDLDRKRLNLVLNAAENRNEIKTILKPTLLMSHGEEAEILVGESIPIEVVVKETIEGSLRDITTVNYKDVGIKLKVKSLVAPNCSSIFLEIFVENSARVVKEESGVSSKFPIINTTQSRNRVILKNGQTTLIGGLLKNEKNSNKSGIPFLSHLPIFGALFRGWRKYSEEKELLIFITPTIV